MEENRKQLLHVRSSVEGKLPNAEQIAHGEIAINFFDGNEKLSIKSSTGNIRTFSTDEQNNVKFALKSELPNVSNFITNTVDNLTNYYTKTETYTQEEVNNLIGAITTINFEVVGDLPQSGEANKIYLVPNETQGEQNIKDEYIWIEDKWELIGSTQIDLSNYYTKNEVDTKLNTKLDSATYTADKETFVTKTEIADMATQTWVQEQGYLTEHQDISNLATKQEVTDGLAAKQDKGDYALKSELPTIVQTIGTSETDVISQKIVTDELNKKIEDAPSDGRKYARMNGEWVKDTDDLAIIEIDQTISDPATMISGNVNGFVIQWIRKNSHRVLAKKTGDGTVTYMELDDNNSNLYAADGSEAKTDGTEGDVFVKLPTFYYKGTEGDNVKLYFSLSKIDDEYVEWDTNTLIGAYEAYYGDGKLYSRSGVQSSGNISQSNFKSYAAARGSGYQLVDWQMHCVLGCLFYAMYGNTNSQAICGSGTRSYTKTCGATNSLGMTDTQADTNGNTMSVNFWGLENWWGNKYEWMQEDNIDTEMDVYDPATKGTRSVSVPDYQGYYPKKMVFGRYLDLIARSDDPKNGSSSVGYCDYQYWNKTRTARVVGRSYDYAYSSGGVSYAYANNDSSVANTFYGSRLAFRGVASKAESVEAFKSLLI